jgi:hypothetical protein
MKQREAQEQRAVTDLPLGTDSRRIHTPAKVKQGKKHNGRRFVEMAAATTAATATATATSWNTPSLSERTSAVPMILLVLSKWPMKRADRDGSHRTRWPPLATYNHVVMQEEDEKERETERGVANQRVADKRQEKHKGASRDRQRNRRRDRQGERQRETERQTDREKKRQRAHVFV